MINNDILRRLRFVFDFSNAKMIKIFAKVGREVSTEEMINLLRKEEEEGYKACNDTTLCQFLDGLIIEKRGLREGAEIPKPVSKLNNNLIFKTEVQMSKSELSALFRNPDHKNFKACGDQILRNFIRGLSLKYRGV